MFGARSHVAALATTAEDELRTLKGDALQVDGHDGNLLLLLLFEQHQQLLQYQLMQAGAPMQLVTLAARESASLGRRPTQAHQHNSISTSTSSSTQAPAHKHQQQ